MVSTYAKGGGVVAPHPRVKAVYANEEGLPKYVTKALPGWRARRLQSRQGTPMGPERRFISKDMLDNLERALAYWKSSGSSGGTPRGREGSIAQNTSSIYQRRLVREDPWPEGEDTSGRPAKTKDEKYKLAMEYVDRVKNGLLDPDAKHIRKIKDGYRVIYPDQKNKQFVAAKKTDAQKLELARDYLDRLRKGEVEENDPECPHVQYICKHTNGFRVQHPDHPWKTFRGAKIPRKEKYEAAKSYLRSLIGETEASSA